MSQPAIAVQLASLRLPTRKALHVAAQLGARAVEIDAGGEIRPTDLTGTALRELRRLLDDLELRVAAVGFQTRRGYDEPAQLDRRVDATKAALRMAADLGARVVVNYVGRVPAADDSPVWRQLLDVLGDLGRHGQHVGAVLAANTGHDAPDDLLRLLRALPPQSLGVNLDPGRLAMAGFSATAAAATLGPHLRHVHVRDGVRDVATRRGHEVALGRGSVDFPALLAVLAEHDYRGYLTIARDEATDPAAEIRLALEFLRSLHA